MTAPDRPCIRLCDPAELIAAVPHMLGFHPRDSVVLIVLGPPHGTKLSLTLRADLPPPEEYRSLAEQLLGPARGNHAAAICLAVVGGGVPAGASAPGAARLGELPRGGLVDAVEDVFADAAIPLAHAVWTARVAKDEPWYCYDDPGCRGRLADPMSSTLAAASAAAGVVTYASREQLAAELDPAPEEVLARRSAMLTGSAELAGQRWAQDSGRRLDVLENAIDSVDDAAALTDEQVVRLATALSDHLARDACLDLGSTDRAGKAERLWTRLVRHTPAPERAEAASLLAFCAYQRGDGALAGIALDLAEAADPAHELSAILRQILDHALPPMMLAEVATTSARQARAAIAEEASATRAAGGFSLRRAPPARPG